MASLRIGALTGLIAVIIGGLIVAYAWHLDYLTGIGVVALLIAGVFISALIALFIPIGNTIVKAVAFVVSFALIVLWGFSYIGVM